MLVVDNVWLWWVVVLIVCLMMVLKLLVWNDLMVVWVVLFGEVMWWCSLVGVLLDLLSMCDVLSSVCIISMCVVFGVRFCVCVVVFIVLVSRKIYVGLLLEMVVIVFICVLLLI